MRLFPLITVLLCVPSLHAQAEWPNPKWEKVEKLRCPAQGQQSEAVGSYRILLVRDAKGKNLCTAYLTDHAGNQTALLEGAQISIYQGTGDDIFGDGSASLVLQDFSLEPKPTYRYKIVDLSEQPVILPEIEDESPFYFFQDPATHGYRIMASDGGFHNFDGRCFDCSPFPRVVLRVSKDGLHDVSPEFAEDYDSEIALARAKIGEGEITKFIEADFHDARNVVLEIVFAYLYSGRETDAWQTLDQMWPAKDRQRIKTLILKTRSHGLLSRLGKTSPE